MAQPPGANVSHVGNQRAPTGDSRPTVSVVIPAYNCARYMSQTLDSVFAQTHPPDEVIVVNDGSTDDLAGAIAQSHSGIIYVEQTNKGVSSARNAGVRRATGDWIAFLDGDDTWHPTKLEKQIAATAGGAGLIFCWKYEFLEGEAGESRLVSYNRDCSENPLEAILTCFFASPSTVLVRRSLFVQSGGFDEAMRDGEDADLWIRLAAHTAFAQVEEPLVFYRVRQDSVCGGQTPREYVEQIVRPLQHNKDIFLRQLQMSRPQFHVCIARSYAAFGRRLGCGREYTAAAWAFFSSARELLRGLRAR